MTSLEIKFKYEKQFKGQFFAANNDSYLLKDNINFDLKYIALFCNENHSFFSLLLFKKLTNSI